MLLDGDISIRESHSVTKLLDKGALRRLMGRPAHGNLASLLYCYVQIQQERSSRQPQSKEQAEHKQNMISSAKNTAVDSSSLLSKRMTTRERMVAHRALKLEQSSIIRKDIYTSKCVYW